MIYTPEEARRLILSGEAPDNMTVNGWLYLTRCIGLLGTRWHGGTLAMIDGVSTLLGRSRRVGNARLHKAWWLRSIAPDKPLPECFVAEQDGTFAHGDTPNEALRDLQFKLSEADFDADGLAAAIRERGTVTFNDFRLLTGACTAGLREGMAAAGLDPETEELPLAAAMDRAHGTFGDRFRAYFEETAT